ncbi:MAG: hypothetical protein QNJ97_27985 [Myxococcota bacterium]|nr:hypothetical protein [Myxococcota bacterium]
MLPILAGALIALGTVQADTSYLYRAHFVRAAPGQLLELIDAYQERTEVIVAAGEPAPFIMRHAQGDHWDLQLMYPMGSFEDFFSPERVSRREETAAAAGVSEDAFQRLISSLASWQEDVYVLGPALETVTATIEGGGYFHTEIFIALPGKKDELFHQREMENIYLAQTGRPQNMIFTKVSGAAWDSFTLGIYRDLQHFAERMPMTPEEDNAIAVAAGFEGSDYIGVYMRSLILKHNDTHGGIIANRR